MFTTLAPGIFLAKDGRGEPQYLVYCRYQDGLYILEYVHDGFSSQWREVAGPYVVLNECIAFVLRERARVKERLHSMFS